MTTRTGTKTGCMLVHGYGGSPFELEGLAAAVEKAGFPARNICLPGHGEGYAGFRESRFPDWLAHTEKELARCLADWEKVVPVGFSLGGTLCLNMAARFPVAGVVSLSAPLYVLSVFPWPLIHERLYRATAMAAAARLLGFPAAQKASETGETSRDIAPWKGYDGPINIPQLVSFRKGCAATRALLPRLAKPLLLMHDARDKLVYAGNAVEIARLVASDDVTLRLTRMQENVTGHHMLPTHRETADKVAEEVINFLGRRADGETG